MSRLRTASFSGRWSHCAIVDSYNLYNRINEYINSSPLLEDTPACRTSAADLSCHLREALDCLAGAFRTLGPRNVMVAFNGGKDATVVFHLFRACLAAHYVEVECQDQDVAELSVPAPGAVYFRYPDEFAEMITFAKEQTITASSVRKRHQYHPAGMTKVIHSHIVKYGVGSVVGTVLGTRMGDPNEGSLQFFEPSSPHFPSFFRINPIIKWTYGCVWKFLLQFNLVYANMYDQGYSSIGT
ncbi:MAG: hypothetical protein KVP17_005091 [Porospora cf. gigantea B]|uniref:uncharacterized protein n=1 Tax=Porospora cf. gigantea B TaxID=2853592 RepID=UPI003571DBAF|nr:MAG: hypothetical protein KVP17_005091 [Porospora cf. gigantea B]